MNLRMTHCIITQNGKKLPRFKYSIDAENNTFSSKENNLVLNFTGQDGWTFKTGSNCTFKTGDDCVFNTGNDCSFDTGPECTFKTGWDCVFTTGSDCTILSRKGHTSLNHFLPFIIIEAGTYDIEDNELIKR